jgi:hypothetical protein
VKRIGAGVIAAAVLLVLMVTQSPAQTTQPSPPSGTVPANQIASVTLARSIKSTAAFGSGEITAVDPTTSFVGTDVPYAVVKIKTVVPETVVTLRPVDPSGASFSIDAKTPQPKKNSSSGNNAWKQFDFAAPLYILGTDLEGQTGAWHLQILLNGQVHNDTAFQWGAASVLALPAIKALVDDTPLNADLHWRYGAALGVFGHVQEAIQELQSAIRLDPRYALYHITLGRLYERMGRPADAVREFKTALTLHGSSYDAVFSGWAQAHLSKLQGH